MTENFLAKVAANCPKLGTCKFKNVLPEHLLELRNKQKSLKNAFKKLLLHAQPYTVYEFSPSLKCRAS